MKAIYRLTNMGIIGSLAIILISPLFIKSLVAFQPSALTAIFLLSLIAPNKKHPIKIGNAKSPKEIITPIVLFFSLGLIEIAHGSFSGFLYCIFSGIAFFSGSITPTLARDNSILRTLFIASLIGLLTIYTKISTDVSTAVFTSNYLGPMAFLTFTVLQINHWSKEKDVKYYWILSITIATLSFTRSMMLGIVVGIFFSYYALKSTSRTIFTLFITTISITAILINLDYLTSLYQQYDLLSLTGKNLETGRGDMWSAIIKSMDTSNFIYGGLDLGKIELLKGEDGKQLSPHNGYISTLSQNGFLGLLMLIALPMTIVVQNYNKNSIHSKILTALVIAFFFREIFEVTFHSNNFPIAGPFWFICGHLISKTKSENY